MNIDEKINQLLKYCAQYHGHTHMIDERNESDFNIMLPEEEKIRKNISHLNFILLTGEAGDGKSRILKNLKDILKENNFEICEDFSALDEEEKRKKINIIYQIINGVSKEKIIIAANIGIFTKTVLEDRDKEKTKLVEQIKERKENILVINFENRNLAFHKESFSDILNTFLEYDVNNECSQNECPYKNRDNCVYQYNINYLCSEKGKESIRVLCDSIYITGGHITFRELLSLLSYIVTFGQSCNERQASEEKQNEYKFYHIFDDTEDILLKKISRFDPAKKREEKFSNSENKSNYITEKRKLFFEETDEMKKYALLFSDYLSEFKQALSYINQNSPFFFDSETIDSSIFRNLKRGLTKMMKRGQTDIGMTIVDTPTMFEDNIQTEFVLDSVETVWNRYDIDFTNIKKDLPDNGEWNKFCLSYIYQEKKSDILQSVRLIIDYQLFCYLMMANDDYYLNRNSLSVEEYAINTFYRKILKANPESYNKVYIKFGGQNNKDKVNFSLQLKEKNKLLFDNKKIIRIKKEG